MIWKGVHEDRRLWYMQSLKFLQARRKKVKKRNQDPGKIHVPPAAKARIKDMLKHIAAR